VLEQLTNQLSALKHLGDDQVRQAVDALVDESVPPGLKVEFLCQLALKGETVEEIAAFACALREKSVLAPLDPQTRAREILDVVGTGGDRLGTFNISTTVAILCSAAGVTVAKHGNRGATSQCGSADVLEALGIRIDLSPNAAVASLRDHNFAFFFAPAYHPAFKHVSAARKLCAERGRRTIFNFLGPLLNPARPSLMLVGVPFPELCKPLARVLQSLGVRRAMVVSGSVGKPSSDEGPTEPKLAPPEPIKTGWLDELSTLGDNTIAEFYQERGLATSVLAPHHFALHQATLADLAGGDRKANAIIVRRILEGDERGPKRDAVLLNAAAALFVSGLAPNLSEGWDLAVSLIQDGTAGRKLYELIKL